MCRPVFSLFCWEFPLYSKTPLQTNLLHKQTKRYLTIREVVLPLGITTDYYRRLTTEPFLRTAEQAKKQAKEQLLQQEERLFLPGNFEKQTETGKLENGVYRLTATYLCRENIAVEVPIEGVIVDENTDEKKND